MESKNLNLIELHISGNTKITIINRMTNLIKLSTRGYYGIGDKQLCGLNLIKLDANSNTKITNVNHMTET